MQENKRNNQEYELQKKIYFYKYIQVLRYTET